MSRYAYIEKAVCALSRTGDALFRASILASVPLLLYHSIADNDSALSLSPEAFERQMAFLSKMGYRSVAPREACADTGGEKRVLITFDDGFQDNATVALPILQKYGFTATVFIATDYMGKKSAYASKEKDTRFPMLSERELLTLFESGWSIGNHFASHTNLTDISLEEAREEYTRAYRVLKDILPADALEMPTIAYPRGRHSQALADMLRREGVVYGFTGENRLMQKSDDDLLLPRIEVRKTMSMRRFEAIFSPTFWRIRNTFRS